MAVRRGIVLFLCVYFACVVSNENDDVEELELVVDDSDSATEGKLFEPTTEWKRIGDDVTLPPGLHVRINLQTGEKEAKLMQESEQERVDNSNTNTLSGQEEADAQGVLYRDTRRVNYFGESDRVGIVNKKSVAFTMDQLRESLKEQKQDTLHFLPYIPGDPPSAATDVSNKPMDDEGRREDEVMDKFGERFLTKEHRAMLEQFDILSKTGTTADDLVHAMHELDYFVHQIDNGEFFATVGGLSLVMKFLNHSDTAVRSIAAQTIGSAAQSNPVVQRQALALNCLNTLIRCLLPTDDSESDTLQRRALFAISNILRHNFDAQHYFTVTLEGVNAVGKDLENSSTKYQLKALVLLTDILTELAATEASTDQKSLRSVLLNAVSDSVWCRVMMRLLLHPNLDHQQKAIEGMQTCADVCDFAGAVQHLEVRLQQWNMHDRTDSFWASLQTAATELLATIRQQNKEL